MHDPCDRRQNSRTNCWPFSSSRLSNESFDCIRIIFPEHRLQLWPTRNAAPWTCERRIKEAIDILRRDFFCFRTIRADALWVSERVQSLPRSLPPIGAVTGAHFAWNRFKYAYFIINHVQTDPIQSPRDIEHLVWLPQTCTYFDQAMCSRFLAQNFHQRN